MKKISNAFLMSYIILFPLWMDHTGYAHLLEAKLSFFSLFAGSYFITVVLGLCIAIPLYREEIREEENLIKKPLVFLSCAFMADSVLAYIITGCQREELIGTEGRYFGLIMWCCVIAVFLLMLHLSDYSDSIEKVFCLPVGITSLIAYLNMLGWNVFHASTIDVRESVHISTMGNIDFFAAYLGISLAYIITRSCLIEKKRRKNMLFFYATAFLGYIALISSSSDTGYLVMGIAFFVLPFLLKKAEEWKHYLCHAGVFAIAGLFAKGTILFVGKDNCRIIYGFAKVHMNAGVCTGILLIVILLWKAMDHCIDQNKNLKKLYRLVCLGIAGCSIFFLSFVVLANLSGVKAILERKYQKIAGYIIFSAKWGNKRGELWQSACETFKNMPFLQKVIGVGPSGYYSASQKYLSAETLDAIRRSTKNIDPHNTFLQSLINFGVVGTVCYLGIFGYAVRQFIVAAKKDRTKLAFIMLIVAYFTQSLVTCFHPYIEPYVFMWIAYGLATTGAEPA